MHSFNFCYLSHGHYIYVSNDVEDPWLFCEANRGSEQNILGNTGLHECTNEVKVRSGIILDF